MERKKHPPGQGQEKLGRDYSIQSTIFWKKKTGKNTISCHQSRQTTEKQFLQNRFFWNFESNKSKGVGFLKTGDICKKTVFCVFFMIFSDRYQGKQTKPQKWKCILEALVKAKTTNPIS